MSSSCPTCSQDNPLVLQSRYRVVSRDPIQAARERVISAQADLDKLSAQYVLARAELTGISKWHLWSRIAAKDQVKDLSFAVDHAALLVTKLKAQAWDTFERMQNQ